MIPQTCKKLILDYSSSLCLTPAENQSSVEDSWKNFSDKEREK